MGWSGGKEIFKPVDREYLPTLSTMGWSGGARKNSYKRRDWYLPTLSTMGWSGGQAGINIGEFVSTYPPSPPWGGLGGYRYFFCTILQVPTHPLHHGVVWGAEWWKKQKVGFLGAVKSKLHPVVNWRPRYVGMGRSYRSSLLFVFEKDISFPLFQWDGCLKVTRCCFKSTLSSNSLGVKFDFISPTYADCDLGKIYLNIYQESSLCRPS